MKHPQTVTVYPEKNENKAAYLLWRSLRAALLTAGALIALMVIWNVGFKGSFRLAARRCRHGASGLHRRGLSRCEKAPAVGFRHFAEISTN